MEGSIILVILFFALSILIALSFGILVSGKARWTEDMSQSAKLIWVNGFLVCLTVTFLVIGPLEVIFAWPLWLAMVIIVGILFGIFDFINGVGWFSRHKATLSEKIIPYVGQVPPPWLHQTIEHGVKNHQIIDGRVVPKQ